MRLSIEEGNEVLVRAEVTAEQVHEILDYLGRTYVDKSAVDASLDKNQL